MAKAINWPLQFRDEILAEDCITVFSAFRTGSLYYDNQYWVPDEIVDIRVNHKKVRQATVIGELLLLPVKALTPNHLSHYKKSLQTHALVVDFLAQQYNQPVTSETLITVVHYVNHAIDYNCLEQDDDPHPIG
jgi:hypothetical protein